MELPGVSQAAPVSASVLLSQSLKEVPSVAQVLLQAGHSKLEGLGKRLGAGHEGVTGGDATNGKLDRFTVKGIARNDGAIRTRDTRVGAVRTVLEIIHIYVSL
jgi:hypothetical protein